MDPIPKPRRRIVIATTVSQETRSRINRLAHITEAHTQRAVLEKSVKLLFHLVELQQQGAVIEVKQADGTVRGFSYL